MDEDKKKSYLEKMAEKLIEWDSKIDELKDKAVEATSEMREDFNKITDDLRLKSKDAEKKLQELKTVGGEGWDEIKSGAEKAFSELADSFSKALSKFKSDGASKEEPKPEATEPEAPSTEE